MKLAFTAFARPEYFEQTLKTWAKARGVHRLEVHVALEPSHYVNEMTFLAELHLPGTKVRLNPTRLGVLENPYQAFNRAFADEPDDLFVILAEEDVIVASDVVEYFEWASRRFYGDDSVLGVCASSRSAPVRSARNVKLLSDFCPLVWGTWKNRWDQILGPTWDHDYSTGVNRVQAGWDWNINLRVMGSRKFVWPNQSRSDHIGQHGGAHMLPQDFHLSKAPSFQLEVGVQDYALSQ